jgi:hypothetical protein
VVVLHVMDVLIVRRADDDDAPTNAQDVDLGAVEP